MFNEGGYLMAGSSFRSGEEENRWGSPPATYEESAGRLTSLHLHLLPKSGHAASSVWLLTWLPWA